MYGRIQADNFFNTTISSLINDTSSSGTFSIASKTVNGYTLEDGTYMFWMIVWLSNQDELEIFRITNVSWTTLTYDRRISPNGLYQHTIWQVCVMTVASDYCNWLSNNTNDFWYTENVTGTGNELKVKVYWGRVENPSDSDVVVADTTLTLTDNTTNYIYFDDTDNTFKSGVSEPETYKVLASVITLSGAITSITDLRAIKAILWAVPLSLSTTDRTSLANVRPGTIVYDVDDDVNYQYLWGSWYPISAGSTQPRATETVEGKVRVATTSEYNANTDVWGDGATLVPKLSQTKPTAWTGINVSWNQISVDTTTIATKTYVDNLLDISWWVLYNSDYISGEYITKWDQLFPEALPTFAQATTVQNIWDVVGNTRVSFSFIGNWVSMSSLKLALKKFASPSVDLKIRIETDLNNKASGSLALWLTESVITADSLTTSLADTTITLSGTVTPVLWTRYHVVLYVGTYGSETVNGTNYYGLGNYNIVTHTSRWINKYNGSSWWDVVNDNANNIYYEWFRGTALNTNLWWAITWAAATGTWITINNGLTFSSWINESALKNYVLSTNTISNSIISFQWNITNTSGASTVWKAGWLLYWDSLNYIRLDSNFSGTSFTGSTITINQWWSTVYTTTGTAYSDLKIEYNTVTKDIKFWGWSWTAWVQIWVTQNYTFTGNPKVMFDFYKISGSYSTVCSITAMYLCEWKYDTAIPYSNNFPYISWAWIQNYLEAKASAKYSYRVSDIPRIAAANYIRWALVSYNYTWIDKTLSYVSGTEYYLSDSAWILCSVAGWISKKIWKSIINNQLFIYGTLSP